jgi:hypothetical protein
LNGRDEIFLAISSHLGMHSIPLATVVSRQTIERLQIH